MGNNLIDRQEAIDAIENLVSSMSVCISIDEYHGMRDMKYRALKAIKECPSAQPDSKDIVEKIKNGITASDGNNEYFIGLRNGMRWCLSLIDDKEPIYESSAQPEIIRCKDCIYYDPPHVENNGVRYEYDEMPADAFDALGTGLVNAEYGINIGGRCCVDYYCKNYSDDKRVFVREDNYCGRAERRTDEA